MKALLKQSALIVLISSVLLSCNSSTKDENDKLKIVVSTGMIADAAQNIVGNHAEVKALMGPGVDPHLYKPTQGDITRLTRADIIVQNGLHLEGKMADMLHKIGRKKPVIAMSDGLINSDLRFIEGRNPDPHIWFSVNKWAKTVAHLSKELQKLDTLHAADYERNTKKYLHRLDSLDIWVKTQIASIPESQRVLITAHDAFGYFGDSYNLKVKGLQGISTVSEFGLKDITTLVDFIIKNKIKAVFVESSVSSRAIEAVMQGCASKNHKILLGSTLYSDAMGAENTPEGTYIGMVSSNVKNIVNGLK